jgi:hypothetical protein
MVDNEVQSPQAGRRRSFFPPPGVENGYNVQQVNVYSGFPHFWGTTGGTTQVQQGLLIVDGAGRKKAKSGPKRVRNILPPVGGDF